MLQSLNLSLNSLVLFTDWPNGKLKKKWSGVSFWLQKCKNHLTLLYVFLCLDTFFWVCLYFLFLYPIHLLISSQLRCLVTLDFLKHNTQLHWLLIFFVPYTIVFIKSTVFGYTRVFGTIIWGLSIFKTF